MSADADAGGRLVCARVGCENPLPPGAVRFGDPYCSRECSMLVLGTLTEEEAARGEEMKRRSDLGSPDAGWRKRTRIKFQRLYGRNR